MGCAMGYGMAWGMGSEMWDVGCGMFDGMGMLNGNLDVV